MKKIINIVYCLCFLFILVIPLYLTNTESNVKSDFDNRVLVEFPEFGETGYENRVKSYLQDRIGFRDQMVTGYQLLNSYIAGELTHPLYTYGQDGYMFFKMHSNISYGVFHKTFAEAVAKMQVYCESRGAKFYFLFNPEKISVYRRYLPLGVNYNDEWVDELFTYMEELGINCINNRDLLIERSFEEQVYNHQFDAGHWNDLGCFYGTNNLWKSVHADFPSVTEYSMDEFNISTKTGDYLANSKFPVYETVPVFSLKSEWEGIASQYSDLKLHKNYRSFIYTLSTSPNAKEYPKMLVFQGSYYNRGPQFFIGRSREYIGVHDYQNVLNLDYYFNIFQPEIVILEVAEYTFSDAYFDSTKMATLDYNPCIIKENESSETAIETAKENAEKFSIESESKLYLIQHGGFDSVYIDKDLSSARYVYLFSDNKIFDLQKDEYSCYGTGLPHNAVGRNAILYYEDYAGKTYYSEVGVQHALSFISDPKYFTYSDSATYNVRDNQYEFTTDIKDNHFNAVNMQLIDGITGEYLSTLKSVTSTGTFSDNFTHKNKTGWYLIRLKGNTNIHDEGIDVPVLLIQGKKYYYSFDVNELSKNKVKIKNYDLFGPCFPQIKLVPDTLTYTNGATYNADANQYEFVTNIEDNRFNAVNLQLLNATTGEYLYTFFSTASTGAFRGNYIHENETGWYLIRLKGNTNLRDEGIDALLFLRKGENYYYSFDVNDLSKKKIIIKSYEIFGPNFSIISSPDIFTFSNGITYNSAKNQFEFVTEIENNRFSSVNLQLIDAAKNEYLHTFFSTSSTGKSYGSYVHEDQTGWYLIRLKGNTNKHDETMDFSVYLENGITYYFSFTVDELSPKKIIVNNYVFFVVNK